MTEELQRVCVYCGAAAGVRAEYLEAAREFGTLLASRRMTLVYGGGHVGLMGAMADAALAGGGHVIGIIPQQLIDKELGHRGISELRVVRDMHERKQQMASHADAFVALPGGWGTLEEMTEMLTWLQLGFHKKPVGILNIAGFYDALLQFAAHMEREGFLRNGGEPLFEVDSRADHLLDRLAQLHTRAGVM
jgi:uncharacterized protein (TIGR00730 family)